MNNESSYPWNWVCPYFVDISIFAFMLIFAFLSFSFNDFTWNEHGGWFQRSGAVIVFLAAIIEYRHTQYYSKNSTQQSILAGELTHGNSLTFLCKIRNYIGKFGILYLIIGTIIWGYGDLFFSTT